jgi:hypothetical protein
MATRTFCDKCGKEKETGDPSKTSFSEVSIKTVRAFNFTWDICPKCENEIITFVRLNLKPIREDHELL